MDEPRELILARAAFTGDQDVVEVSATLRASSSTCPEAGSIAIQIGAWLTLTRRPRLRPPKRRACSR